MNFAALEYLPFLFACVAVFPFLPARGRVPFLLAASYAFYAWAVPWHAALLAASTLAGYGAALWIGREARPARRRAVLVASSAFQLGLLAWFKYSGFLAETVRDVAALLGLDGPSWPAVVLPLGISFYTFQILSSTIDVYRRRIEPCRDLALYALYVAYFPQLVAGPIERAAQLLPQLRATRPAGLAELSNGGRLVLWGLVKKGVLADRLAPSMRAFVEAPERHSSAELLVGTLLMMAVLYLDFSAYTDIARGSARLFGVELVENFRRTFLVTENRQFWNRWHMSLGRWLGDYVHAPLSKGVPTYASIWRNTLIVMGLFGLWHGAGWNFVVLGFTVGSLIAFEHSLQLWRYRHGRRAKPARGPLGAAAGFAWTMLLNSAILVLFFAPDLRGALHYYRCLLPVDPGALRLGGDAPWIALAVAGLFAVHAALARLDDARAWERSPRALRAAALAGLAATFLLFRVVHAEPFVYFRF